MLYLQHTITLGIFSLLTWGCGNSDKQKGEAEQAPLADKVWYSNPVIDSDNPDPTVIKRKTDISICMLPEEIHGYTNPKTWFTGLMWAVLTRMIKNRHGNRKQVFGHRISIISMENM